MNTSASSTRIHGAAGVVQLGFQLFLTAIAIAALTLMPTHDGAMLIVPLTGTPAKPWLDQRNDISFSGLGKLPGSLVVIAHRNSLFIDALTHGALLLPALPALCATTVSRKAN
jgi:hypothetical protein